MERKTKPQRPVTDEWLHHAIRGQCIAVIGLEAEPHLLSALMELRDRRRLDAARLGERKGRRHD